MNRRTALIVMLAALALLAVEIALLRFAPDFVNGIDAWVGVAVAPLQTLTGVEIFLAVTTFGSAVGTILIAAGWSYVVRLPLSGVFRLSFALIAVTAAEKVVKELFLRARPDPLLWLDPLQSYSFPSAHAAASITLYGFIAVTLYLRTKGSRRAGVVVLPLLVAFLIGASRIVLSVHYFSDVVGGYLVGSAILAFAYLLPFERIR